MQVSYRWQTVLCALLGPQSCFWNKPFKFPVICPQNGIAVLVGLRRVLEKKSAMKFTRGGGVLSYHSRYTVVLLSITMQNVLNISVGKTAQQYSVGLNENQIQTAS